MRYFTYMADQSFKTAPNGERLFFPFGFLSRPYIIPDAETERRIHRKVVRRLQIMLGGAILLVPLLNASGLMRQPLYFLGILAAVTAVSILANKLSLASDLRGLKRTDQRPPVRAFFGETARKHGLGGLLLGFAGCLAFVAIGLAMGDTVGLLGAAFFALCGVWWGYALWLKLIVQRDIERQLSKNPDRGTAP